MPDIIHLLPDSVANQIAAGEVIQRPASVIKELVENAVDAGASHIDVLVVEAGRTSIQVIDDGKGMSETDARLAFERHATSKIQKAEDLFTLKTMGFRGEALPSIAAVAQVTLRTRMADNDLGTILNIEGSKVLSQEVDACPAGSNFMVQNLFFNIPARRKFLKSNKTELSNIINEFERIALVNPNISFTLTSNGVNVSTLPATSLKQRIDNVFGKRLGEQMLPVDVDTTLCSITGFVGRPDAARKKGVHQYFFVNGRYMRHPYFHKAVMQAFEGLIQPTDQIPYFLYFTVDPANIDVNIHPTKTEIKFENEQAIWQIIVAAIRESMGRFNSVPTIDFDTEGRPDIPTFSSDLDTHVSAPRIEVNTSFNPFHSPSNNNRSTSRPAPIKWEELYQGAERPTAMPTPETMEPIANPIPDDETLFAPSTDWRQEMSNQYFQFRGQYIMTAVKSGLMLIDQHRAHVRVLYNRYRKKLQANTAASQGLLFPEVLQLSMADAVVMDEILEDLQRLGFDLSPLGGGSYSVRGIPTDIEGIDPLTMLQEMVGTAAEKGVSLENSIHHRLALTLARSAAIPTGQVLSREEMEHMVDELFSTDTPNLGPDGKSILAILPMETIEKMF